jgi:DNA-binding XRE family transcriptional regulator
MADYPLEDLREARQERDRAEELVVELVGVCRGLGYTWERIASALGVTRQSAWERYAGKIGE